jgi:hypothetical protein
MIKIYQVLKPGRPSLSLTKCRHEGDVLERCMSCDVGSRESRHVRACNNDDAPNTRCTRGPNADTNSDIGSCIACPHYSASNFDEPTIPGDTFVTTAKLTQDAARLAGKLAHIGGVVGVARSGLLPASILATQLHLPLWSVGVGGDVVSVGHGHRFTPAGTVASVVIVDDTVHSGQSLSKVFPAVRAQFPNAVIERAAVYTTSAGRRFVDHAAAIYDGAHYLEWNFANGLIGRRAAFDLDGIICHDPKPEQDDDGQRYADFIRNAQLFHLPRRDTVPAIITARPESCRQSTAEWLARHGVKYGRLVMRDFGRPPAAEWVATIGAWKAAKLLECGQSFFVESSPALAQEIANRSGHRVLCPAAERVFHPASIEIMKATE